MESQKERIFRFVQMVSHISLGAKIQLISNFMNSFSHLLNDSEKKVGSQSHFISVNLKLNDANALEMVPTSQQMLKIYDDMVKQCQEVV